MSDATDVMRVLLAEENANWNALTASSDLTETLAAGLDEMRAKHAGMVADLPKVIASDTAATAASDRAQRRRNTVIGRINRVAPWRLSPAMELLLDAEDRRYRAAQIAATKARQDLERLKWDIECLGSDIAQTEGVLTPPRPQLMEVVPRPQPAQIETDDIVMPPGSTRAA